jgi:hypothetical protein
MWASCGHEEKGEMAEKQVEDAEVFGSIKTKGLYL